MDLFVNCTVSAEVVSCHELGGPSSDGKVRDPNILKSIELDRKSGAFHAVVWLKSNPTFRRDRRGTCRFEEGR